jgi:hypothetical protein
MKNIKSAVAFFITIVAGISGAIFPFYGAYQIWGWIINQVPVASEWAGLIKVGITLAMILFGSTVTLAIAVLCGVFAMAVVGFITGLFR